MFLVVFSLFPLLLLIVHLTSLKAISRNHPNVFSYFNIVGYRSLSILENSSRMIFKKASKFTVLAVDLDDKKVLCFKRDNPKSQTCTTINFSEDANDILLQTLIAIHIEITEHISDGNSIASASLVNQESSTSVQM